MSHTNEPPNTSAARPRLQRPQHAEELAWLQKTTRELVDLSVTRMNLTLPWFAEIPASRRRAIQQIAHTGIQAFIEYYRGNTQQNWVGEDIFGSAPRELIQSISLQETLQLIEVVVSVVEERVAQRSQSLRLATLKFSRDVAFAAADLYARAAEARGLWDVRLEALVVDAIITGESTKDLASRIAALGWNGEGNIAVLVGTAAADTDTDAIRRTVHKAECDALIGVQGERIVLVLGNARTHTGTDDKTEDGKTEDGAGLAAGTSSGDSASQREAQSFLSVATSLRDHLSEGPLVLGPTVTNIVDAHTSARAALAGTQVIAACPRLDKPVHSDNLLPERAFIGDALARKALVEQFYVPIREAGGSLLDTLTRYIETGGSLEGTSRELGVHTNTVRYRLKKINDLVSKNPAQPRDAFVLHAAIILGAIHSSRPQPQPRPRPKQRRRGL
jgi:hypothetical protein